MKKRLIGLAALAASVVAATMLPNSAVEARQYEVCYKSPLCNGALAFFQFEEGSDSKRISELGGYALEKDGVNVPNAAGKFGNAASFSSAGFDNDSRLVIRNGGNALNGVFTVAMWIYPTDAGTNGQNQLLIDTRQVSGGYTTGPGFKIYLNNNSGSLQPNALVETDNATQWLAGQSGAVTLNQWNSIVAGVGFTADSSAGIVWTAINGTWNMGTNITGSVSTKGSPAVRDLLIAASQPGNTSAFRGRIDHLLFAGRQWDNDDIAAWHNSGSGRAWPFVTE